MRHQVPSPHGPVHTRCQYPGTRGQHISDGVRVRPDGDTATPEEDPEGDEVPEAVQGRDGARGYNELLGEVIVKSLNQLFREYSFFNIFQNHSGVSLSFFISLHFLSTNLPSYCRGVSLSD